MFLFFAFNTWRLKFVACQISTEYSNISSIDIDIHDVLRWMHVTQCNFIIFNTILRIFPYYFNDENNVLSPLQSAYQGMYSITHTSYAHPILYYIHRKHGYSVHCTDKMEIVMEMRASENQEINCFVCAAVLIIYVSTTNRRHKFKGFV